MNLPFHSPTHNLHSFIEANHKDLREAYAYEHPATSYPETVETAATDLQGVWAAATAEVTQKTLRAAHKAVFVLAASSAATSLGAVISPWIFFPMATAASVSAVFYVCQASKLRQLSTSQFMLQSPFAANRNAPGSKAAYSLAEEMLKRHKAKSFKRPSPQEIQAAFTPL